MNRPPTPNDLRPARTPSGFTLLELLVALAIFALMAVAIYSSLGMLMKSSARLDEEGGRLKELQSAMRIPRMKSCRRSAGPVWKTAWNLPPTAGPIPGANPAAPCNAWPTKSKMGNCHDSPGRSWTRPPTAPLSSVRCFRE